MAIFKFMATFLCRIIRWHHLMSSSDGNPLFSSSSFVWTIDMFWIGHAICSGKNLLDTGICSAATSFTRSTFISVSSVDKEIVWSGNIHVCIFVECSPSHIKSWDKFMVSRRIISLICDVGIEIWWVVADVVLKKV